MSEPTAPITTVKDLGLMLKIALYDAVARIVRGILAERDPTRPGESRLGWIINVAMIALAGVNCYFVYHFQLKFLESGFALLSAISLVGIYVGYSLAEVPGEQEKNVRNVAVGAMVIEAIYGTMVSLDKLMLVENQPLWLQDASWQAAGNDGLKTATIFFLALAHGVPATIILFFVTLFLIHSRVKLGDGTPALRLKLAELEQKLREALEATERKIADAQSQAELQLEQMRRDAAQAQSQLADLQPQLQRAALIEQLYEQEREARQKADVDIREMLVLTGKLPWLEAAVAELQDVKDQLAAELTAREEAEERLRQAEAQLTEMSIPAALIGAPKPKLIRLIGIERTVDAFMRERKSEDEIIQLTGKPLTTIRPAMSRVRRFWEQENIVIEPVASNGTSRA